MTSRDIFSPLTFVLLAVFAIVTILGFFLIPADAIFPVHWGPSGVADGFMERDGALLMMATIVVVLLIAFTLAASFLPKGQTESGRHVVRVIVPAMLALFLAIQTGTVLIGKGQEVDMVRIITLAMALLLVVLGNVMPKTQPNAYAGLRLPWTMADAKNWQATHRLTGLLTLLAGLALALVALLGASPMILILALLTAVFVPLLVGSIYSYRLSQRRGA